MNNLAAFFAFAMGAVMSRPGAFRGQSLGSLRASRSPEEQQDRISRAAQKRVRRANRNIALASR